MVFIRGNNNTFIFFIYFSLIQTAAAGEWYGSIGAEYRDFIESPIFNQQKQNRGITAEFDIEYLHSWNDFDIDFIANGFYRSKGDSGKREHADIRELYFEKKWKNWIVDVGIRRVFWGVVEFNHIIDIINQVDNLENIDGEDRLGQPMISVNYLSSIGSIDFFIMPYFRERKFNEYTRGCYQRKWFNASSNCRDRKVSSRHLFLFRREGEGLQTGYETPCSVSKGSHL